MSTELPDASSGALTVPGTASRPRSNSLSIATEFAMSGFSLQKQHALLLPIPVPVPASGASSNATPSSPPMAALTPPTSPLSASLRAFSTLTLSPPTTLDSDEFQKALSHARRASFSKSGARPIVVPDDPASNPPGMSGSPTSSAFSDQLPTPSSSPQQTPANSNIGVGIGTKAKVGSIKGGGLGGVCEKDELALADDEEDEDAVDPGSAAALSSSTLFADGARWGWPQSSKSGTSSPPGAVVAFAPTAAVSHARRASGPTLIPLGRGVSAGAGPPLAATSSSNGLGLFRRLSVGGFGSKPKAPSPPTSATPLPSAAAAALTSLSPTDARSSAAGDESRGRKSLGPSKSTKRQISPFGERMLHGMHH